MSDLRVPRFDSALSGSQKEAVEFALSAEEVGRPISLTHLEFSLVTRSTDSESARNWQGKHSGLLIWPFVTPLVSGIPSTSPKSERPGAHSSPLYTSGCLPGRLQSGPSPLCSCYQWSFDQSLGALRQVSKQGEIVWSAGGIRISGEFRLVAGRG